MGHSSVAGGPCLCGALHDPSQISEQADSTTYDVMAVAQAATDQARVQYETAEPPGDEKDALNALIRSYNAARDSWLTYRSALERDASADVYMDRLTRSLSDLTKALRAFKEAQ